MLRTRGPGSLWNEEPMPRKAITGLQNSGTTEPHAEYYERPVQGDNKHHQCGRDVCGIIGDDFDRLPHKSDYPYGDRR